MSVVQLSESAQLGAEPAVHTPAWHVSFWVHPVLSALQLKPLAWVLHASVDFSGSHTWQLLAGFTTPAAWQTPPIRHEEPRVCLHVKLLVPVDSQVSAVQVSSSLHPGVLPSAQVPSRQLSFWVQPSLSASHAIPLFTLLQLVLDDAGSQVSHELLGFGAPAAMQVASIRHPLAIALVHENPLVPFGVHTSLVQP